MKIARKITGLFLAVCLIVSVVTVGVVPAAADTSYETYAQDTVQGSNILHCFDWSYNNIKARLPQIAAAGYTAVQTSPVQRPKDYNAYWTDGDNQWWKMYQPLGLSIAADGTSWLGTKAELTSLCEEADKYNIKVIVDIVANHLANNGSSGGGFSNVNSAIDTSLKNANYFHSSNIGTNDNSRYNITQYHLGMPDLNTGNTVVQTMALALLQECIDCGVDGFRFDAAKHIELPTDNSGFASGFWPTVINGATDYAEQKGVDEPFYYGEILGAAGPNFSISNYTTYMAVTDNQTGDRALDKAFWASAGELADSSYMKGASADKSVLWVESHDTYMGNSGSAWQSNTKDVTSEVINMAWAIVGARAESTALFFARPNSTMGAASSDNNWRSPVVTEVNKFKNHFAGTSEYLSSKGTAAYIERGTKGVVISKLDGGGSVSLPANKIANGSYTDQITGSTFTVSNGVISGQVGSTGVAVVYNPQDDVVSYISEPTLYLKPSDAWTANNSRFAIYVFNGNNGEYEWADMSAAGDGYYSADLPSGNWTNVIFCRMNGSNQTNSWSNKLDQTDNLFPETNTNCYDVSSDSWSRYTPSQEPATTAPTVAPTSSGGETYTVYAVDNAGWNTGSMNIYYWNNEPQWPGVPMTSVSGTKVYKYDVPKDINGLLFNTGGSTNQTVDVTEGIKDGAVFTISKSKNDGKNLVDVFYLVGTMTGWNSYEENALSFSSYSDGKLTYKLAGKRLDAGAEFKIHSTNSTNGGSDTWYPTGDNHTVASQGTYDIYFRPNGDGDSTWLSDSNNSSKRYVYTDDVSPCTVTWQIDSEHVLATDSLAKGSVPSYSGAEPSKEPTADTVYTFIGWKKDGDDTLYTDSFPAVTGDVTYTAQFSESVRKYTVTWKNYDGETLDTDQVTYGSAPEYTGETPTRPGDGVTEYVFVGWSPMITPETAVTEDVTYTARFGTNIETYTITWQDGDGNALKTESCIKGVTPHYSGETPTKIATAQYTYAFNNTWEPPVVAADRDTVYTAQFDSTVNKYTITFRDEDGSVLQSSQLEYGTTPVFTGEIPTKDSTLTTAYTFSGWEPSPAEVTGAQIYTATYSESPVDSYTIKVTDIVGWDQVCVYYWGAGSHTEWPGVPMTADSDNFIYTAEIPVTAQGLLFTDGSESGTKQTVDVTGEIRDGAHWAILNEKDEDETAKYKVHAVPTYYLVGTTTNWQTDTAPVLTPLKNDSKTEEYALTVTLSGSDQIKVYGSDDAWYPAGSGANYTVAESGVYEVFFRPNGDGNDDWHEDVLYLKNVTPCTVRWIGDDGEVLRVDTVTYGDTPVYGDETPTKQENEYYSYTFNRWIPAPAPVTGDASYTASFDRIGKPITIGVQMPNETVYDINVSTSTRVDALKSEVMSLSGIYTLRQRLFFNGTELDEDADLLGDHQITDGSLITVESENVICRHSLTLEGDIGVNFYLKLYDAEINNMTFVDFRINGEEESTCTIDGERDAYTIDGETFYKATCNVCAPEMTDLITIKVFAFGQEIATEEYSVKTYADYILSDEYRDKYLSKGNSEEDYEKLAELVTAMLNYGGAAQLQFESQHPDNEIMANEGLPEPEKLTPAEIAAIDAEKPDKGAINALLEGGELSYYGYTMLLHTETKLRFYFRKANADADVSGVSLTRGQTSYAGQNQSDKFAYVEVDGIPAYELNNAYTLCVNGTDLGSYSALTYIKDVLTDETSDDMIIDTVTAMYRYHEAAVAYFPNH